MKIKSIKAEFGKIEVGGKPYKDVIILPSGVFARDAERARAKYGTSHVIDEEEIQILTNEKPEIIFIGKGFDGEGVAHLTDKAREKIKKQGIELAENNTPEAIKKFLKEQRKKAVLLHSTC